MEKISKMFLNVMLFFPLIAICVLPFIAYSYNESAWDLGGDFSAYSVSAGMLALAIVVNVIPPGMLLIGCAISYVDVMEYWGYVDIEDEGFLVVLLYWVSNIVAMISFLSFYWMPEYCLSNWVIVIEAIYLMLVIYCWRLFKECAVSSEK